MKRSFETRFFQNGIFESAAVLNRGMDVIESLVFANSKNGDVLKGFWRVTIISFMTV
jgi:hypothetical protein